MVTVIILAKNEEGNIEECIKTVLWCAEVIVIDDFSTDRTRQIAKKLGAKVFSRNLDDDFAAQRNFGLEKASEEWVFFVDADERVTEKLASEILNVTGGGYASGFYIRRRDVMWGRQLDHGEVGNVWLLRLAKKSAGLWTKRVHEIWGIGSQVLKLNNPIFHYPHQTLREFIEDINYYSTLHARQKYEDGKHSNLLKILLWPKLKFLNNWIFRLGFLDGTAGFVHAVLMSFHSFLAWSNLWLWTRELPDQR